MSQNKTVFPGAESNGNMNRSNRQQQSFGNKPHSGTRRRATLCGDVNDSQKDNGSIDQKNTGNSKPIAGFLYSISRTSIGEFWPLYVGQNKIGTNDDCDIVLREATVSGHHAILHINKMKRPEKTEATIIDCQSTNGTMINGNSVSVARPELCNMGDVITIGNSYELLVILIDTKACGLSVAENFISTDDEQYDIPEPMPFNPVGTRKTRPGTDEPHFVNPDQQMDSPTEPGTVGIDPTANRGFTKGKTEYGI